jgi:hypothetical protein
MYAIEESMWVRVAEMHLQGAAKLWYQSVESEVANATWPQFCQLVRDRFDRDQHELLMRQIFQIKQTSSVSDYITSFSMLVDQLSAYNKAVDPVFYITRFVDGLRPDIRSVVIVQCPKTLDTACTLALLQEEAGVGLPKELSRTTSVPAYKSNLKNALPLPPLPAAAATKPQVVAAAPAQSDADSKLSALEAYRRAVGL